MAELSGKQAKILYTSVTGTSSTDNAATRSTGVGSGTGYIQINDLTKRHFDRANSTAFRVYRGSSQQSASLYDINYVQGKFQWRSGDPSTGTYTIDAVTLTSAYLVGGRSWSMDTNVDMLETTTFSTSTADVQWREFIPGLSDASVNISRLISTGDTGPVFYDRVNAEASFIVELVFSGRNRLEAYANVEADSWSDTVDGLAEESVDLRVTGPVYYSTV